MLLEHQTLLAVLRVLAVHGGVNDPAVVINLALLGSGGLDSRDAVDEVGVEQAVL